MPTKTFSGRAEVSKLDYADALAQREHGMSYGQFCSSLLLDHVHAQGSLPDVKQPENVQARRQQALARMRQMSEHLRGSQLATMGDDEMKQLIASRYE